MNYLNLFGGIAALGLGGWLTVYQSRLLIRGEGDELGWDIKGLSAGILFSMLGIYLLFHLR
jgi:hypothetical protein